MSFTSAAIKPASTGAAMETPNETTRQNFPYDLRLMLWLASHEDDSRVILAGSSMVAQEETDSDEDDEIKRDFARFTGSTYVPVKVKKERTREQFLADIFPDEASAISLAKAYFAPEVEQDPSFMQHLFQLNSAQEAVRHSKNIHFVPNLRNFAISVVEANRRVSLIDNTIPIELRKPLVSMVSGREIESIAIEAWAPCFEYVRDELEFLKLTEYLVEVLYALPNLKRIYVVQKSTEDPRTLIQNAPRFTKQTLRLEDAAVGPNDQTNTRPSLKAEDVQAYQNTSRTRSIIQRIWDNFGRDPQDRPMFGEINHAARRPCPTIKIVSWDVPEGNNQQ